MSKIAKKPCKSGKKWIKCKAFLVLLQQVCQELCHFVPSECKNAVDSNCGICLVIGRGGLRIAMRKVWANALG